MFKTAVSLEQTGKAQVVVLDKTGTITNGTPKVTDILPVKDRNIPGRAAENTGRLVFLQHDPVVLHENFQLVPLRDIQCTAQLNGQDDTAQIVNLANDTSRLHVQFPLTV
jgi:high-affinity K+ transport system ATPase subunit B